MEIKTLTKKPVEAPVAKDHVELAIEALMASEGYEHLKDDWLRHPYTDRFKRAVYTEFSSGLRELFKYKLLPDASDRGILMRLDRLAALNSLTKLL
jgi:hypothetical protein